ncbi:hypothetical protein VTK73DRAFT_7831 [Phialemonium thermophilum]|uniref:Uncharacterized protein n=1 Tax=Phialemonium thermophilum TaxID=223376 RepID=A0ABR3XRE1_9PEZI
MESPWLGGLCILSHQPIRAGQTFDLTNPVSQPPPITPPPLNCSSLFGVPVGDDVIMEEAPPSKLPDLRARPVKMIKLFGLVRPSLFNTR